MDYSSWRGSIEAILRAWLAFCSLSLAGWLLGILAEQRVNPLLSDDPYIVGWVGGALGALLSLILSGLSAIVGVARNLRLDVGYLLILIGWSGLLVTKAFNERVNSYGHFQMYLFFAGANYVCGAVFWLISHVRLSFMLALVLSIAEVGLLGMYLTTIARMAARTY